MIYLGLGAACQVTHQLRRIGLVSETMFYDWLVTHHIRLIETLPFNFGGSLFQEGYTLPAAGNYLVENATGLSFYPHDFQGLAEKDRALIDEQIDAIRDKYIRRADRTRSVLSSGEDVCIVRHFFAETPENIIRQQGELIARLSTLYPETNFSYLWGSDFKVDQIELPFGTIHHLPKASTWHGDDAAWDKIFAVSRD